MAEYSRSDIERMQREAVRRVQEMQNRARRTVESTNAAQAGRSRTEQVNTRDSHVHENTSASPSNSREDNRYNNERRESSHGGRKKEETGRESKEGNNVNTKRRTGGENTKRGKNSGGLLQSLNLGGIPGLGNLTSLVSNINGDTALLISLGLLLLSDDADELLILAIIYIMM